jgi:purine-nucleoside phosphorylase
MIRFDPDKTALFNPSSLDLVGNPTKALMIFDDEVWEDYVKKQDNIKVFSVKNTKGKMFNDFFMYKFGQENILLVSPASGAGGSAMSAVDMELLIASGINKIVAFGTCGAMDIKIAKNTIIIPNSVFREEGVSYHYLPPSDEIAQEDNSISVMNNLFSKLKIPFLNGKAWTTDAVYRETAEKFLTMKNNGCIAVDMELASLIAVAKFRNINFAGFLITDDNICEKKSHEVNGRDLAKLFQAALDIVTKI